MAELHYHEEEALGRAYDSRLMRRLLGFLKPYKFQVAMAILLVLAAAGLEILGPWLVKVAIDGFIAHDDLRGLSFVAGAFLGVLVLEFGVNYFQMFIMQSVGQRIMYDLRLAIFERLQRMSLPFYDRNPVGRLMTRITSDVDVLNELFTSGVVAIVGDIVTLLGIMIAISLMNAELALVAFSVLPLIFIVTLVFRARVRETYREVRTALARMNSNLQENITGMTTTHIMNREERQLEGFRATNAVHRDANIRSIFYYAIFFPTIELIGAIATGLIIWYGGRQVMWGGLTLGGLVAFLLYAARFFRPISDMSEKYNILQSAMASSERVFKLLDAEVEVPPPAAPRKIASVRGDIRFDHVSFAYQSGEEVLRDVSFHVAPGQKVAIVGATGAGKTTIISLLTRFYDVTEGAILVDGVDVREWDLTQLRRSIGVVLQDVFLFSGTVEENLRLGEDLPQERLVQAAREVHADPFIRRLPGGYGAEVKERGATFSTGEKQLLAFARALAFDPRILVLDEATSSVDTETELLIQDALHRLMQGRTSIVIAHRLSTIQDVDRIVVLHKGQIRETGTHQELLAQRGIYHRLYELQYRAQERPAARAATPGSAAGN
ncbi:MAG: ABC transporter ATP-binding protein [Candidatus Eiseniibacteriota bacterium]